MATGKQTHSSDVDVLVLGDPSFLEVVKAFSPIQAKLGREINPVVMTANKFITQLKIKDRFAERVFAEPKIFVIGGEDDFREFTEDQAVR